MKTNTQILEVENINSQALLQAVSDLLDQKISALKGSTVPKETDPFITRQDVADLFKISLPTVHAWMNAGILTPYKIGNKTRFRLSEVKAAAINIGGKRGAEHE